MQLELIATTTMGLEKTLSFELKDLGYQEQHTFNGRVEYSGDLMAICKSNLWLRTAGRVMLKIGEFEAKTFDELYEKTKNLPWGKYIGKNDAFPIAKASAKNATLYSKSDSQAIVKKAIAQSLKAYHNVDNLPETGSHFAIRIQNERDRVLLSIDTSGDGLNKRGYREIGNDAPLRETLAAGLVLLSRWNPKEQALLDPMCGTATILIEATMIARNIAPGLKRKFVAETWDWIPQSLWLEARNDANKAIDNASKFKILGYDIDSEAVKVARENIQLAGFEEDIVVEQKPLIAVSSSYAEGKIITNPPYGERLYELNEVEALYREMGKIFKKQFRDWDYYVITSHDGLDHLLGIHATKRRKLYNGGIKCQYYMYY